MVSVSVIIPAFNEEASIKRVVAEVRDSLRAADVDSEIVVVVDGATDATKERACEAADRVVVHPQNFGYGRSLKSGILAARHELIAITDADGTYPVARLPELIRLTEQFDMVVGARTGTYYRGSVFKMTGRYLLRRLSEFSVGQPIPDINSGMRVFRRGQIEKFFPVISAGFSFTTTSTLAYMHNDLCVHYVPIEYHKREGSSKVRHFRDSLRAFQIIVEAILRCNPVKVFILLASPLLALALIAMVVAILWNSTASAIIAAMLLSTAAMVLAVGFLAVSIMPYRRIMDAPSQLLIQSAALPTTNVPSSSLHNGDGRE